MQDQPDREREVEEDMGQNHAVQAIDRDRREAHGGEAIVEKARASEDREKPEDGDDDRQKERCAQKRDQRAASGKPTAGQSACDGDREKHADRSRERGLQDREPDRRPVGGREAGRNLGPVGDSGQRSQGEGGDTSGRRPSEEDRRA